VAPEPKLSSYDHANASDFAEIFSCSLCFRFRARSSGELIIVFFVAVDAS
jgi:hypothetical protein